jgi:serine/threonine protein kinase
VDSSEFESVFQNENLLKQKLHDGKYFSIEKVKISHRWEIKKSIQEKEKANPVCIESLKREFEIGSQLQHPFICSYYKLSTDDSSIHREYIDGLTWNDYFDTYPNELSIVEKYILQLMDALQYMHSKGVFHMDLKPENILISQEIRTIKIIDFGHALYQNDTLWRGGVKSNVKTENLISAEQDWNAFFSIIQSNTTKFSRICYKKIQKAYNLFIKSENQFDFQQSKAIFENTSKFGLNRKIIVLTGSILCFSIVFMQLNRPYKKEDVKNPKQKATQRLIVQEQKKKAPTVIEATKNQKIIYVLPKNNINRILSIEDSLFFVGKGSLFGPDLEKKIGTTSNKIQKNILFQNLLDEYELNFYGYIQNTPLDSLQRIKAKEIYNFNLSKSFNSYVYLINP